MDGEACCRAKGIANHIGQRRTTVRELLRNFRQRPHHDGDSQCAQVWLPPLRSARRRSCPEYRKRHQCHGAKCQRVTGFVQDMQDDSNEYKLVAALTARSMPRLSSIGLAPAVTFLAPSR